MIFKTRNEKYRMEKEELKSDDSQFIKNNK